MKIWRGCLLALTYNRVVFFEDIGMTDNLAWGRVSPFLSLIYVPFCSPIGMGSVFEAAGNYAQGGGSCCPFAGLESNAVLRVEVPQKRIVGDLGAT